MIAATQPLPKNGTRTRRVANRFLLTPGEWVPGYEIQKEGGLQFGARIFELRHFHGLNIECRTEQVKGETHSFYRFLPGAAEMQAPKPPADRAGGTLFEMGVSGSAQYPD